MADKMADKAARQAWRRGRLWSDTLPAVTGVPRLNFFSTAIWCDLVRFGAIGGEEFKVQGSKFKVQSSRFKVQGSRFKVQGSRFKVQSSRFKVQGSKFKVQGSKFKVQSSKFKVQGSRSRPELEEAKIAGSGRPPARLNLVGSLFSLLLGLIGFD
jgi:hypothetical protein